MRLLLHLFGSSIGGATAATFALITPLLMLAAAVATDLVHWKLTKARLQRAADGAAVAAARELGLARRDERVVAGVARRFAAAQLATDDEKGAKIDAELIEKGAGVAVSIVSRVEPILGRFYPEQPVFVRVNATARISGGNVCAIGLAESDIGALSLRMNAKITANDCGLYSRSKNPAGLVAYDSATVSASLICSSGGVLRVGSPRLNPAPTLDCPRIDDPLAGRPEPAVGPCLAHLLIVVGGNRTLKPGAYCGGVTITAGAKVTLEPGIYVFKDGPLVVEAGGSLHGRGVGLFFKDSGGLLPPANLAAFVFGVLSTIDIAASRDGPMAGILIAESARNRPIVHFITSDNARNLLGTIYLPKSVLTIDGTRPVADQSAYTVIVARSIKLESGPNLVLNSDYASVDVPVPTGLGPAGRRVTLVK